MSLVRILLFVDLDGLGLVAGLGSSAAPTLPVLTQNDTVEVVLQGVRKRNAQTGDLYAPAPIDFSTIKIALAYGADVPPTDGTICIGVVGGGDANVTPPFPPNVAKPALAALLNALPGVTAKGGVRVLTDNQATNIFHLAWVNAAETAAFEWRHNLLSPRSETTVTPLDLPDGKVWGLKIGQLPIAFTDQFSLPVAPPVSVAVVRTGNGTRNAVQSITVPRAAVGSASFTFANLATRILPVAALNVSTIAGALNEIYSDALVRFTVTAATTPAATVYTVECVGPLALADQPAIARTLYNQEPLQTPTARLPIGGPSLEFALDGAPKIKLILELEITSSSGDVATPVQAEITIRNDIISSGLSLVSDPNYNLPSGPDFPPYDPEGNTIAGTRSYVTTVGTVASVAANNASFVIQHNLGTKNCIVEVRETGGTQRRLPDNTYTTAYPTTDTVQIDFAVVPALGQFEVMIIAALTADIALPHHTHPISDIVGLQDILTALLAGQNPGDLWPSIPDSKLPRFIAWRNTDGTFRFATLPKELLPPGVAFVGEDGGWYVVLPGPPPVTIMILDPTGHIPVGTLPLDPSTWPGLVNAIAAALAAGAAVPPGYIPIKVPELAAVAYPAQTPLRQGGAAVFQTLTRALVGFEDGGAVSGALPKPSTATDAVCVVSGGASAAAVRDRAPQHFEDGARIGSDGTQWFEVVPPADDALAAYPAEMERELFTVRLNSTMLARNCRFAVNGQLTLALAGPAAAATRGQYTLRVSFGHKTGPALSGVVWDSDPIEETIIVADAAVTHSFGVSVTKEKFTDTLKAARTFYGRTSEAVAPAGQDFIVRGVLTRWDLEDVAPVQGQVKLDFKATAAVVDLSQLTGS